MKGHEKISLLLLKEGSMKGKNKLYPFYGIVKEEH